MPRFPSAQGRLNHDPGFPTLAVTKTCPKDGVHLSDQTEDTGATETGESTHTASHG